MYALFNFIQLINGLANIFFIAGIIYIIVLYFNDKYTINSYFYIAMAVCILLIVFIPEETLLREIFGFKK